MQNAKGRKRAVIREFLFRVNRPAVHWSASAAGGALAGARTIDAALGHASKASWPEPVVLGAARDAVRLATPLGTNGRTLVAFSGARAIDQNGIIELADGSLLAEPAWHPDIVEEWLRRRRHRVRSRRQRGPWFSCLLEFSCNYYHWICDVLPRFSGVLDRLPADVRFVVPGAMAPWHWDSLAALGIPPSRCAQLPRDEAWAFDELYYAGPAAVCGDHDPTAVAWLRDAVVGTIGRSAGPADRRLYVTRRLTRRSIVNEDEFWPVMADAGFTLIEAERLTFVDQVRAFASATCVVAPHGAGLANITWCPAPATVIEIVSPRFASQRCVWTLASALGHRHAIAVAADCERDSRLDLEWNGALVREILEFALRGPLAT